MSNLQSLGTPNREEEWPTQEDIKDFVVVCMDTAIATLMFNETPHEMLKNKLIVGRPSAQSDVDIDMGKSTFISRKHLEIYYNIGGSHLFHAFCPGKNGIMVNGAIHKGPNAVFLPSECVLEFPSTSLRLNFTAKVPYDSSQDFNLDTDNLLDHGNSLQDSSSSANRYSALSPGYSFPRYFIKVPKTDSTPGKGAFWRIDQYHENRLIDCAFKKRRRDCRRTIAQFYNFQSMAPYSWMHPHMNYAAFLQRQNRKSSSPLTYPDPSGMPYPPHMLHLRPNGPSGGPLNMMSDYASYNQYMNDPSTNSMYQTSSNKPGFHPEQQPNSKVPKIILSAPGGPNHASTTVTSTTSTSNAGPSIVARPVPGNGAPIFKIQNVNTMLTPSLNCAGNFSQQRYALPNGVNPVSLPTTSTFNPGVPRFVQGSFRLIPNSQPSCVQSYGSNNASVATMPGSYPVATSSTNTRPCPGSRREAPHTNSFMAHSQNVTLSSSSPFKSRACSSNALGSGSSPIRRIISQHVQEVLSTTNPQVSPPPGCSTAVNGSGRAVTPTSDFEGVADSSHLFSMCPPPGVTVSGTSFAGLCGSNTELSTSGLPRGANNSSSAGNTPDRNNFDFHIEEHATVPDQILSFGSPLTSLLPQTNCSAKQKV